MTDAKKRIQEGREKENKKERPNERNCHAQILIDNNEDEEDNDNDGKRKKKKKKKERKET